MYIVTTGAAMQAAAASTLELWQKAITQHFSLLQQGTELSQKLFATSLEVDSGSALVEVAQGYFANVHKLASEVVCAQLTLAGDVMRAGCQSLIPTEAVTCPAPASDKVEKVVAGGDIAEAQERAPEDAEILNAMMETTVAPARARRKSRPKKA